MNASAAAAAVISSFGDLSIDGILVDPSPQFYAATLNEKAARYKRAKSILSRGRSPVGDCYDANGRYFIDNALFPNEDPNLRLVHGEVQGQGPLEGTGYGHCWVEDGGTVIDVSNGRNLRMPKAAYYAMGRIGDNTHVYTPEQARKKLLQFKHWGPWDLKTSSGL